MRGKHDTSNTYPFFVKAIPGETGISHGHFRVFNMAKQEFHDNELYETEAACLGACSIALEQYRKKFPTN